MLRAGDLMQILSDKKIKETYLIPGAPPMMRVGDAFAPLLNFKLTADNIRQILLNLHSRSSLVNVPLKDAGFFSIGIPGVGRFQVYYFTQRGSYGIYIHLVEQEIPTLDNFHDHDELKTAIKNASSLSLGLILITGPFVHLNRELAATIINMIATERQKFIVTLEQPISYTFPHKKSLIIQREVGIDVPSFEEGIEELIKLPGDVVFLSDAPTKKAAQALLRLAESGKLLILTFSSGEIAPSLYAIERYFDNPVQVRYMYINFLKYIFLPFETPSKPGLKWIEVEESVKGVLEEGNYNLLSQFIKKIPPQ